MELTGRVGWAFLLDGGRIGIHGAEVFGAPGRDRTCDNQLRRLVLYPTELRARGESRTITDQPNYPVGLYTITRPPGRASHGKSARPGGRGGGRVQCMAEGVGFEPTEGTGPSTAFKAAAFVHSATPPFCAA